MWLDRLNKLFDRMRQIERLFTALYFLIKDRTTHENCICEKISQFPRHIHLR